MAEPFRILAQVNPDQLGFVSDPVGVYDGFVPAKSKWNSEFRPYCVPNEVICAELGRFIGLPIPPYAVTYPEGLEQRFWFSSLKFSFGYREDRPVLGDRLVDCLPVLAAGILVFDVLIVNSDRHEMNLKVDDMNAPTQVRVYDHDQALFGGGGTATQGVPRLNELRGRLGITGGTATGGNRHELLDHFRSNHHFGFWCDRIYGIPTSFIQRICGECKGYGLNAEEAEEASRFLDDRKYNLRGMLNRHKREFIGIEHWVLL